MGCGNSTTAPLSKVPDEEPPRQKPKTPRIVVDKAGVQRGQSNVRGKISIADESKNSSPPGSPGGRPQSQRSLSITINNHLAAPILEGDTGHVPGYPTIPGRCYYCGDMHTAAECAHNSPIECSNCRTSGHKEKFCALYKNK